MDAVTAPVRIGIAGAGRLTALGYLPAASVSDRVEVVSVADPDPVRRDLAAAAGVTPYASTEAMVAAGGIEAIVVASPAAAHEPAARIAAAHGLAALVEKPPAPDLAGALRIAALDPAPYIAFNRRFGLGRGLGQVVPAGGEIELELRYRRFRWAPVEVRDPALLDLAPHLIDLALRAGIGAPRRVTARSRRPERIVIEIEGDAATARLDCACDRMHRESAIVRDPQGATVVRRRIGGILGGVLGRVRPGLHPLVASLAAQLDEFGQVVRGNGVTALAGAMDGAAAMAVVAAAAESLARGGAPAFPPDLKVPA